MNTLTLHGLHLGQTVDFNNYEAYRDYLTDSKVITYVRGNRQENLFNNLYNLNAHNVKEWFIMLKQYKALSAEGRAAVRWLIVMLPNGCIMERALELAPTVGIYNGYEIDYVTKFVNEEFKMQHKLGHLVKYFDYAGYCFDLQKEKKIDKVVMMVKCIQ